MCYEFSDLFERARARQLRKEQQREEARKREPAPAKPASEPSTEAAPESGETIPA